MSVFLEEVFPVEAGDYVSAGQASTTIKRKLKQLGINALVLRRVSVASYEVELNLVIHSMGGGIDFEITDENIIVHVYDVGPGIPDIEKAMTEGYSTATNEVRNMGFGAGMGLPNMKRNADGFKIESEVGKGTDIVMTFDI